MKTLFLTLHDPSQYPRPYLAQKALGTENIAIKCIQVKPEEVGHPLTFGQFLRICYSLNQRRYKGVICLSPRPLGRIAKYFSWKLPFIIDAMDITLDSQGVIDEVEKDILSAANGVIFWSKAQMDLISRQITLSKYSYVPAGLDLGNMREIPSQKQYGREADREKVVMYFGYFWRINGQEIQGIENLIRAMAIVEKENKNVRLVLSGFSIDEQFQKLIKESGIKKVSFLGSVPLGSIAFLNRLGESNVLVLPTSSNPKIYYAEQHKLFIYMFTKRPIVATDTAGVKGVLDSTTAIIAKVDDPEDLANAILKGLCDLNHSKKIAGNAYDRLIRHYTWDALRPKYHDFVVSCFPWNAHT